MAASAWPVLGMPVHAAVEAGEQPELASAS
jgi:hypothetical protein